MRRFSSIIRMMFFLLLFAARGTSFAQSGRPPYPIIFVHGLYSNADTWLAGLNVLVSEGYHDGGVIKVTLCQARDSLRLATRKEDDVHIFKDEGYEIGDIYRVNFQVHAGGLTGNDAGDHLRSDVDLKDQSINVQTPSKYQIGDILCIDNEFMRVLSKENETLTVQRGLFGSTILGHDDGRLAGIYPSYFTIWNLSLESNQASIVKQGWGLKQAIEEVKSKTGADKVILFGHSMGGLAIREYLQSPSYQHDVAKAITLGTPHGGSNLWADPAQLFWRQIDPRSDAIRDLRYSNGNVPGTYLFSGEESNIPDDFNYYNKDVNADGINGGHVDGLSKSDADVTYLIPSDQKPLPSDVRYTWITSDFGVGGGDKIVDLKRQWLHAIDPEHEGAERPFPFSIADTLLTDRFHTYETDDTYSIVRGLDEPDQYDLAYHVHVNTEYSGTVTYQMNNSPYDVDIYKFDVSAPSMFEISFTGMSVGLDSIRIMKTWQDRITGGPFRETEPYTVQRLDPGTYYIVAYGSATATSWQHPYIFHYQLTSLELTADFTVNVTKGHAPLTVQFNTIISGMTGCTYRWDFKNDGTAVSTEKNPSYTYTAAGTYSVKLTVSDGTTTKTILKPDLITITDSTINVNSMISGEYFFDDDPGAGKAKAINLTLAGSYQIDTKVDIGGLTNGIHTLGLRVKDSPGRWSATMMKLFLKEDGSDRSAKRITAAEYFYDLDPGYGKASSLPVTEAADLEIHSAGDLSNLSDGLHIISIRAKDNDGQWSYAFSKSFIKAAFKGTPDICRIEYFFDNDPGYGKGTPASGNASGQDSITVTADLSNLSPGIHVFFCRVQDAENRWSMNLSKIILVENGTSSRLITSMEYFFDTDPGWGKGNPIVVNAAGEIDVQCKADIHSLSDGCHRIYVRVKDNNDQWSRLDQRDFEKVGISIPLRPNWNLVSWNIDTPVDSVRVLFAPIIDKLIIAISSDGNEVSFDPKVTDSGNTLKLADHLHGYWLKMTDTSALSLSGPVADRQLRIPLKKGYNLVSCLPETADSLAHALKPIMSNMSVVMGFDGEGMTFDPSIPDEFNTLKILEPGCGYWIRMKNEDTLEYPANSIASSIGLAHAMQVKNTQTSASPTPTREWISLWGSNITVRGKLIPVEIPIIATTSKGVVCGAAKAWAEGKFGLMPIYSDDPLTAEVEGPCRDEEIILTIGDYRVPRTLRWIESGLVINLSDIVEGVPEMSALPKEYLLTQNYPNPFNPATTIRFQLPKAGMVLLKICDILGREVAILVNEYKEAGYYETRWQAAPRSSGIYFYTLRAGEYVKTLKMQMVK